MSSIEKRGKRSLWQSFVIRMRHRASVHVDVYGKLIHNDTKSIQTLEFVFDFQKHFIYFLLLLLIVLNRCKHESGASCIDALRLVTTFIMSSKALPNVLHFKSIPHSQTRNRVTHAKPVWRKRSHQTPPPVHASAGRAKPTNRGSASSALQAATERLCSRLETSIVAEAEEQRKQINRAYGKTSDKALVQEGMALTNLIGSAEGRLFGEFIWTFCPTSKQQQQQQPTLPRHKFKQGAAVNVRPMGTDRSSGHETTVLEVGHTYISLTISADAASILNRCPPNTLFRIEQGYQDTTAQRQLSAVSSLAAPLPQDASRQQKIIRAILLQSPKSPQLSAEPPEWMKNPGVLQQAKTSLQSMTTVNDSQRRAIAAALSRCFTLWQGPPGTGKTRTLLAFLELMCQLQQVPSSVIGTILAVADTNAAADNLLKGLIDRGVYVVRVGRPAQVRPELRHACVDAIAEASPAGKRASALRDQATMMLMRVREALEQGRVGEREMRQAQREAQQLWSQADRQVAEAEQLVLSQCDVIVGTCASAGEGRLAERQFKMTVIDEATQATEPSTLVALTKGAECVVMAGDHKQLPPTVVSRQAAQNGLDVPLFARLQYNGGLGALLLTTQYRMHPAIATFPSQQFYEGKIECGVTAEQRPLISNLKSFSWPGAPPLPLVLLTCSHVEERANAGSVGDNEASYRNRGQAEIVCHLVDDLLCSAKEDEAVQSVAVLTPYNGQVRLLSSKLQEKIDEGRVIVSTIDGFQGREADIVIFSTVRCNNTGALGFVADPRRMNVAITRAKRGLIVIGSEGTLQSSPDWMAWLKWMKQRRLVVQASGAAPPLLTTMF